MHFNDHIIQVALLGTDKQQLNIAEADEVLQPSLRQIADNTALDKEESLLQSLALNFNYRRAGAFAPVKMEATIEPAPAEEKQYAPIAALRDLKDILDLEADALLRFWLQSCIQAGLLVTPEFIKILFDEAARLKNLWPLVSQCCGKRGEWLAGFNPDWKFTVSENIDEIWETGTLERRKQALLQIRKTDAAKAIQLLQSTWATEDAHAKTILLGVLENDIGEPDRAFLEQLAQQEKSKKVKDIAVHLLKLVPSSTIVQQYINALRQSVSVRKEKALLGLILKKVVNIDITTVDASVFAIGIEKLSNIKGLDDATYIACQLIQSVPPPASKALFELEYEELAQLFSQQNAFLLAALIGAAIKFKDPECLQLMLPKDQTNFYKRAITLLPSAAANNYMQRYFEQQQGHQASAVKADIIETCCKAEISISSSFGAVMCEQLALDMYRFNRKFYNNYIHLFPPDFPELADKYTPQQSYVQSQWGNMVAYIRKLMQLKTATIHHFNTKNN